VDSYKSGLAEAKKSLEDVQKKVRDLESMLSAKDRIINDLRLQVIKFLSGPLKTMKNINTFPMH
jgi:cell division protein FtsL